VTRSAGRYGRTYLVVEPSEPFPIPEDLQAIADTLSKKGYVANEDLRALWGVSRFVAWRRVKKLVEEGFLRQEGEKSGTRYYPAERLEALLAQRS